MVVTQTIVSWTYEMAYPQANRGLFEQGVLADH